MMADDLPDLSEDQTFAFIDMWEAFPCLWNPKDDDYKNKGAKAQTLENFANIFMKGWTTALVQQKVDSLKSSFRKERARVAGSTGAAGGKRKKGWGFFERINSFYGTTLYDNKGVTSSSCPMPAGWSRDEDDDIYAEAVAILQPDDARHRQESGSSSNSLECLGQQLSTTQVIQGDSSSTSTTESRPTTSKGLGNRASRKAEHADSRVEFHAAATGFLMQMQEARGQKSENQNFAVSLTDDLRKIKSTKRLCTLKNAITNLVHAALMEEMPDDD